MDEKRRATYPYRQRPKPLSPSDVIKPSPSHSSPAHTSDRESAPPCQRPSCPPRQPGSRFACNSSSSHTTRTRSRPLSPLRVSATCSPSISIHHPHPQINSSPSTPHQPTTSHSPAPIPHPPSPFPKKNPSVKLTSAHPQQHDSQTSTTPSSTTSYLASARARPPCWRPPPARCPTAPSRRGRGVYSGRSAQRGC